MAMDAIKSWFESKPDYTEKIPEALTMDDFNVHSVSSPILFGVSVACENTFTIHDGSDALSTDS